MEQFFSTKQVAKMLGLKPQTFVKAIWDGRVDAPAKSPSGGYLWTIEDVQRASWAILHKAYETTEGK